jgi:hypothetical protein
MANPLTEGYRRWKQHPKRFDFVFLLSTPWRRFHARRRAESERKKLLYPAIDITNVEILTLPAFRDSCAVAARHTLLDVARLANLWYLARMAGDGIFLEVGSYKGGGALHICNAVRGRSVRFYSFDPFEEGGFRSVGSDDSLFSEDQFTDTTYDSVVRLLAAHPNATVVKGYFPSSAEGIDLRNIAFCHLDVDVYDATRESLAFLRERLTPRGIIVLDDMNRRVGGVQRAVEEFVGAYPEFMLIPLFPGQALLFSPSRWAQGETVVNKSVVNKSVGNN